VEIESNLQAILNEWQSLENDFNTAVTDIKNAVADASSANFNTVVAELDDAISEWAAAYKQAGDLHLDLNVNDAQLTVGMSSAEVQQATAKGTTSDIITYYNKVQNQRAKAVA
jgi:chaperonin cofactor prefoldin